MPVVNANWLRKRSCANDIYLIGKHQAYVDLTVMARCIDGGIGIVDVMIA